MDLTELAYTQARRDAQPPERQHLMPGPRPSYMPPPKAAYDSTLASNFFQEFSRCARQAILLEARLDSGAYDTAPAVPLTPERRSHAHQTPRPAPAEPRPPSDETRIHHERLEDEFFACDLGDPDETLRTVTNNLNTAIARTRAAGLDLRRQPHASPSPGSPATNPPKRGQIAEKPVPPLHPARNPARHPAPKNARLLE